MGDFFGGAANRSGPIRSSHTADRRAGNPDSYWVSHRDSAVANRPEQRARGPGHGGKPTGIDRANSPQIELSHGATMFYWFRARALSTVVGALVLIGAASGPPALYLALNNRQTSSEVEVILPDVRAGVAGEFAALFVAAWLRGDDLGFFNRTLTSTESGFLVERVGAVRTAERGQGMFDVVVAADLVEFISGSEEQFRPVGLRYYAVGVAADDAGDMAVLGLPSVVAAPPVAESVSAVVTEMRLPTAPDMTDLNETLVGFFEAYLTGAGDVSLFTSPNAAIGAVEPPPFGKTRVAELGWSPVPGVDDPAVRLARVIVDAQSPSGNQLLEYSIVVAVRDDRWEVSQVLHAPVVVR